VRDLDILAFFVGLEACAHLHRATRVASDHNLGAGGDNGADLVLEHGLGHLGVDQVVDSPATAATVAVSKRHQFELRDSAEKIVDYVGFETLSMDQVAGLVVGYLFLDGTRGCNDTDFVEKLTHIPHGYA